MTDKLKDRANELKRLRRIKFAEFKATLSCTLCGESHPATLDFHHHTPNITNRKVNHLITNGAFKAAKIEITNNCTVLCTNCHRKLHHDLRAQSKV